MGVTKLKSNPGRFDEQSSDPEALLGTTVGSFELRAVLGAGGAGTIYLGVHPAIGTRVAVKVLRAEVAFLPGMSERFLEEARATSELHSPHLPRFYDFGKLPSGQPYAILELLEGQSLSQRLIDGGWMPIGTAVEIAVQVASALAQVHEAGIVHRDVKPENLFLTQEPGHAGTRVKLIDFGIAKRMGAAPNGHSTANGIFLGSPCYCAPEQALGHTVNAATDVYALGATLFTMLTARPPFEGDVLQILSDKTLLDAPDARMFRPEIPADLAELLADLLARKPAQRPQSMEEVLPRLRALGAARISATRSIASTMMGEPTPPPYAHYTIGHAHTAGVSVQRARVTKAATGVVLGALVLLAATYAGSRAGSAAPPVASVVSSVVPSRPAGAVLAAAAPAKIVDAAAAKPSPDAARPVPNPDAASARLPDAPAPPPPKMRRTRPAPMVAGAAEAEEAVYLVDPYEETTP